MLEVFKDRRPLSQIGGVRAYLRQVGWSLRQRFRLREIRPLDALAAVFAALGQRAVRSRRWVLVRIWWSLWCWLERKTDELDLNWPFERFHRHRSRILAASCLDAGFAWSKLSRSAIAAAAELRRFSTLAIGVGEDGEEGS